MKTIVGRLKTISFIARNFQSVNYRIMSLFKFYLNYLLWNTFTYCTQNPILRLQCSLVPVTIDFNQQIANREKIRCRRHEKHKFRWIYRSDRPHTFCDNKRQTVDSSNVPFCKTKNRFARIGNFFSPSKHQTNMANKLFK